jgi:hypothetical protein
MRFANNNKYTNFKDSINSSKHPMLTHIDLKTHASTHYNVGVPLSSTTMKTYKKVFNRNVHNSGFSRDLRNRRILSPQNFLNKKQFTMNDGYKVNWLFISMRLY